jgi:hypothetical protein
MKGRKRACTFCSLHIPYLKFSTEGIPCLHLTPPSRAAGTLGAGLVAAAIPPATQAQATPTTKSLSMTV